MFIIADQIEMSLVPLERLHNFFGMSYLAFKKARLPVAEAVSVNFSSMAEDLLTAYYKPSDSYAGFYNPFKTSRKEQRWLAARYGSTALQRITKDTFKDALLHPNKKEWGWRKNYVQRLKKHLAGVLIPAFHLGVWLFRGEDWPETVSPAMVMHTLFREFNIDTEEAHHLFDRSNPDLADNWVSGKTPITEAELLQVLGLPPGAEPEEGAAISFLGLRQIGPAQDFQYAPADRLNIITGDNSLGKSFILESIWWALTGKWINQAILPRKDAPKNVPLISYKIRTIKGKDREYHVKYDWNHQSWLKPKNTASLPGLVIYARFDGSFAVWDPVRSFQGEGGSNNSIILQNSELWGGLPAQDDLGRTRWICNGLLRDWVTWQTSSRYGDRFATLRACLKALSPDALEPLVPGEPTRVPEDSQEIPSLVLPYGEVPILHASAGIQRIVGLAYVMVWAWHEHLTYSQTARRLPQRRLVLLIDEVEAHLHPRWQRVIVPGVMAAIRELSISLTPQLHLATHSPLVMASAEPLFHEKDDDLHHLRLDGKDVVLEKLDFVRRGTAEDWLLSDVFALNSTRSVEGEKAIADARRLQLLDDKEIDAGDVKAVHDRLVMCLAPDDAFWPKWLYFAEQKGAVK